jgi:hypothetical protein
MPFSEEKLVIIGSVILGTNFILFVSNDIILIYGAGYYFCLNYFLLNLISMPFDDASSTSSICAYISNY